MSRAVSYYELLEVKSDASPAEIDDAYHRLSAILEPDSLALYSMAEEDEVAALRARVEEAYRTLSDPERRAAYDSGARGGNYPSVLVPDMGGGTTLTVGRFQDLPQVPHPSAVAATEPTPPPSPPVASAAAPGDAMRSPAPVPVVPITEPAAVHAPGRDPEPPPPAAAPAARLAAAAHTQGSRPRSGAAPLRRADGLTPIPGSGPGVISTRAPVVQRPSRRLTPARELVELSANAEVSGALLKSLRESAGASLDEVADITKISKRYLRAIEDNDFQALPAQVYVRGFVSEYARVLGLDAGQFAKSYMSLFVRYRKDDP